jgi:hypothetical protein
VEEFVDLGEHRNLTASIGGLMLANVDLPPSRGDTVELGDIVLRIERVQGMMIECVAILYPPEKHLPNSPGQVHSAGH